VRIEGQGSCQRNRNPISPCKCLKTKPESFAKILAPVNSLQRIDLIRHKLMCRKSRRGGIFRKSMHFPLLREILEASRKMNVDEADHSLKTSQLQGQFDGGFANGAGQPKSAIICETAVCLQGACNQPDLATWVGIGAAKSASRRNHFAKIRRQWQTVGRAGATRPPIFLCRASD
jgi:hypothetical protein